jgi:predicted methyltransferase
LSANHLPGFFPGTGMPDRDWWSVLFADPAAILTSVGLTPGMTAIDLCAGDGHFTDAIARVARHVWAIDLDPLLLDQARERASEPGRTTFVAGDAYDTADLVPQPVDMVFLANAFHGAPDKPGLARAVWFALAPGGRFVVLNWHARPREETIVLGAPRGPATALRMTPDAVAEGVLPAGFALHDVVDVPPIHYASVFIKRD